MEMFKDRCAQIGTVMGNRQDAGGCTEECIASIYYRSMTSGTPIGLRRSCQSWRIADAVTLVKRATTQNCQSDDLLSTHLLATYRCVKYHSYVYLSKQYFLKLEECMKKGKDRWGVIL